MTLADDIYPKTGRSLYDMHPAGRDGSDECLDNYEILEWKARDHTYSIVTWGPLSAHLDDRPIAALHELVTLNFLIGHRHNPRAPTHLSRAN